MKTFLFKTVLTSTAFLISSYSQAQELAKIPSNFDTTVWARATENPPQTNIPRPYGEFPSACSIAHIRFDDPIQKQGQFGQSPLHAFVGNTLTNANSTYQSLRGDGDGTCFGGPLNRSAIYFPTMMNAQGKAILPDFVDVFYRGTAATKPFPRGLRMIFGYDVTDNSYVWDIKGPRYAFSFGEGGGWWSASTKVTFKTLVPNVMPDWAFDNNAYRIAARAVSPDCWDGKNLDSADHRSHLAYSGPDDSVAGNCPATHPVKIPQATVTAYWSTIEAARETRRSEVQGWYLSSDRFGGRNDPPGTNFYVGMIPAWDDDIMSTWVTKVLNKNMFGALGKLNDGRILELPPTSKTFSATKNVNNAYFLWSIRTDSFPYGLPKSNNNLVDPPKH